MEDKEKRKQVPKSILAGTGCFIPEIVVSNSDFLSHRFLDKDGSLIGKDNSRIIQKFQEITGIEQRRYARTDQKASDLGFLAASDALESSGFNRESLDYIIVAHNFGDIVTGRRGIDIVPNLASRIKSLLGIKNPDCVAYDLPFGCAGWLEGLIQADYFIRSGDAKACLVIGAETLSRVIDPTDRDSMLYGDGSGAAILIAGLEGNSGILSHKTQSYCWEYAELLSMKCSYDQVKFGDQDLFLKMNGRKLYEFALTYVPLVIKTSLERAGISVEEINKVLIHQANEKMDLAILERLFNLYGLKSNPSRIMPMTISWLGNSSVATIPTLLDLMLKGKLNRQEIHAGDKIILASVGAGMNINSIIYQV
ncbi:MAG: 3-oxoacyl-ACP synthase III family protein [Chitinophagaceae bacterium]